jgi:hypothetical protein
MFQCGICEINTGDESATGFSAAAKYFPENIHKFTESNGYNDELQNCDERLLYYKQLPNKLLDLKKAPRKIGININKARVALLLYSNKTQSQAGTTVHR